MNPAVAVTEAPSTGDPVTDTDPTAMGGGLTPITLDPEPLPVTEPLTVTLMVKVPSFLYVWLGP